MTAALDVLERWLRRLGSLVLLMLALCICLQVVARYAFAVSPIWSEELIRLLLIWTVMIGAAISVRQRSHIRLDVLLAPLPPGVRRIWMLLLDLLTLLLFGVLVWTGIDATIFNHGMQSLGLQWHMSVLMAAIPAGFLLAGVFQAERIAAGGDDPSP